AHVEAQGPAGVGDVEHQVVEADHGHAPMVPRYGPSMADDAAANPLAQVLGRLRLSGDQLSSLQQQLGRVMPSEQMKLMRDLVDTFAPSGDQLSAIRRQLEAQRVQVEAMLAQLEDIET